MKKLFLTIMAIMIISTQVFAQDVAKEQEAVKEDDALGLDFSINYYSKYIWRGIDFYAGDGYFYPSISWEPFGSGFRRGCFELGFQRIHEKAE